MPKQPHSDKSGRATRRREEKQVQQAQRTIARAQPPTGSVPINLDALLAKMRSTIGGLTVERDALQVQLEQRDELVVLLQKALEGVPAEEETPVSMEEKDAEANE